MSFIIIVILILFYFQQRTEIKTLRNHIDAKNKGKNISLYENQVFVKDEPIPIPLASDATVISDNPYNYNKESEQTDVLLEWIKQDFMVKLGAFMILLALGWFVSYAFANDWIGEVGRILLGLFVGIVFMVIGVWRIPKYSHQGGIFTILGASTILLTTYAARELYEIFTPTSALMIMFLAVTLVGFVSVRYNSERLAMAGLVIGSFAPMLTAAPVPEVEVIFPYLMVIVAGTLWVVWSTGWTKLTFVALLITYIHSLPFLLDRVENRDLAITFSFLFVAIFFVANLVSLVRRRTEEKHIGIHALTALGTVIFLFSWIQTAADSNWQGLLYAAWALVFAFGSYVVFVATANYKAFYLYSGTAVTLIGLATAVELAEYDDAVLAIAFALEIMMLIYASSKIMKQDWFLAKLSLLFVIPVLISIQSIFASEWTDGINHPHFLVLVVMAITLTASGFLINSLHNEKTVDGARTISATLLLGGLFYLTNLIWLVPHALFIEDTGTMFSLILYTIIGIGFYVTGRSENLMAVKIIGIFYITAVVLRLLLVEIWNMETGGRIITFFVVGVLFISTAFIRKLSNEHEEKLTENQQ